MRLLMMTRRREERELTRTKLGALSEVHPARVGQIENQRVRPYPPELQRIAAALDWPAARAEELLEEVESE
jgi:transcriptional regulator with XRE-family HTH domain